MPFGVPLSSCLGERRGTPMKNLFLPLNVLEISRLVSSNSLPFFLPNPFFLTSFNGCRFFFRCGLGHIYFGPLFSLEPHSTPLKGTVAAFFSPFRLTKDCFALSEWLVLSNWNLDFLFAVVSVFWEPFPSSVFSSVFF